MTYDFLLKHGKKLASTAEGTCFLYSYKNTNYVVLCDNSVITQKEDNELFEPFFPL